MGALLFYLIAIVAVASALAMIFGRNATHSVLLMVVNFVMISLLYLMLGSPFLAAVQIIVYAGAILILFLFVVMLMGNDPGPMWEQIPIQRPLGLLFTLTLIVGMVPVVELANITGRRGTTPLTDDPRLLAEALFSRFALPFELTSLVLLAAMIGGVVLAKRQAYRTSREEALNLDEVV